MREVCRRYGISEKTYYRWKQHYGGLQVAGAKRLKALEDENRRLKQIVADQALDLAMLRDVVGRKWWRRRRGGGSSPTSPPPSP